MPPLHHLPLYAALFGSAAGLIGWAWIRWVHGRRHPEERRADIAEQALRMVEGPRPVSIPPASEVPEASRTLGRRRTR